MADWRHSPLMVATAALHLIVLGGVLAWPARWPIAIAILIASHVFILINCLLPRSPLLGSNTRRIRSANGCVALTFDDGPDPELTPRVLDLLDSSGAKATFFCVGQKAAEHPEIVAEIRQRGHDVQNHSYRHSNLFALWRPRAMQEEIDDTQDAIERASGVRPRFFRAPAGIQNPWLFPVLNKAGISLVSWTRRGFDTVTRDGERVAARLTRNLRAGDILVLHDRMPVVLDALPRVLDALAKKELRSERLSALL